MSTFDIRQDTPGLLRSESLNISIKFDRTSQTTGRISWNIPTPAAGCGAGDQAYCGILITIDTTPSNISKSPTDGVVYSSDSSIATNLFVGDKISTALVVGAFYNNRTTTFFDVTGLTPNTPYYVSGFPTDCQYRYFREGIHAYSLKYDSTGTGGTSGTQVVILRSNQNTPGVSPDDYTNLMPGITYDFNIQLGLIPKPKTPVDPVYCNPAPITHTLHVSGSASAKYRDLVTEINKQLSLLTNCVQGPSAPNTGAFYLDGQHRLLKWDGHAFTTIETINQVTPPNVVSVGTYWLNQSTSTLKFWNGSIWVVVDIISSAINPLSPIPDKTYWFDGTNAHVWNGTTLCTLDTRISSVDPTVSVPNLAGAFWLKDTTSVLHKWDNVNNRWLVVDFIQSEQNPSQLVPGSFWFDESTNVLNKLNNPSIGWNPQPNVSISERAPLTPAPGKFWYNPTQQSLLVWDAVLINWVDTPVISFPFDPTVRNSCDNWWNPLTGSLWVWNDSTTTWVPVSTVYDQTVDPASPTAVAVGSTWFNPSVNHLYSWDGVCYVLVDFVQYPTNPITGLIPGIVWHDLSTGQWLTLTLSNTWEQITPIDTLQDPTQLSNGTIWVNISNNTVQLWNGVGWSSILTTNSDPTPPIGTHWFDSTTNTLLNWSKSGWIESDVKSTVELDCHGNLLFTDTTMGSLSYVKVTDVNLFKSLGIPFTFHSEHPGTDGVSSQASYNEIGIGTDGSLDERLALISEIKYELGYPVVDVELTPEQLDYAVTKAISELRTKSGICYKRGFFFMQTSPETQRYLLTNKIGGFNKIVEVLGIQRLTSSFLSSAHGAGVYGQIIVQHLYNMGTFDLLSYHLMAEYTKTMEILFAARLTYTWNESSRELWIHHRFPYSEPYVSIEATVERTEQEIISDRYSRPWVRRYATAVARLMLAEIRGKFSSLPGAGGNITLNANDLRMAAKEEMEACLLDIENYITDRPEEYGMATTFVFG